MIAPRRSNMVKQEDHRQKQRKPPEPLRRAVADCLSSSHHDFTSEPARTLEDYLANPSTIHFAYTVLVEHALAERDRSPPVVIKCVSYLKRYLFRYVPPVTTLQQIDSFCSTLIRECNAATGQKSSPCARVQPSPSPPVTTSVFASEALVKSLNYVRAVVARHLPGFQLQHQSSSSSLKLQPLSLSSPRHYGATVDKEFPRPPPGLLHGLASIEDGSSEYIAIDLLKWRWIARKGIQIWMPSPVMIDSGGIARPHVENVKNLEQGAVASWLATAGNVDTVSAVSHLVRASTAAAIADRAAVKSHLRDVAASKRHLRWGGEPLTTVRKLRPLFQYRCYSQQQPLRLSDADIEEVIACVCGDATSPTAALVQTGDTASVASTILIKLIIDMYLADARTAAPLTLSILQLMLSAVPAAVRVRAFDLVFNLGVHAQLLEPMQSEDSENVQDFSMVGTPPAVGQFESWLLTVVCEMMLFLIQLEEKEEVVWASAMSTLLYLICDRGHIRRDRLERLDVRVLRKLLDISRENAWAEEVHSRLIRMLCNLLYVLPRDATAVLDVEKLEAIGGIEVVCKEYALAYSLEAKRNLFTIIFDYIVVEARAGKKFLGEDEVQAIATVFVLGGAPESLSIAFRHRLSGVGGKLAKSIVKALDRDIANGRLNALILEELTKSIDTLIDKHGSLEDEFKDLMSVITADETHNDTTPVSYLETRAWAILHALLHSPRCDYRRHGYLWLNHLLATEADCLHVRRKEEFPHKHCLLKVLEQAKVESPDCKTSAVQLLFGLLKSRRHYVRQGFLIVLEHLLSHCQRLSCSEAMSDDHASTLVWLMSGSLWQFISANDTNRVNVLQMCNLMLSQISIRRISHEHKHSSYIDTPNKSLSSETVLVSSLAALFLREEAAAPKDLVTKMPTALFYWPLMQLASATMDDMTLGIAVGSKGGGNVPGCASDVRAAILLLLVGKCTIQQAALEEVGGVDFFRSLLDDADARIAYYTASFLIKRMMVEDADKYQRILHSLVFKAQQKNDEKLLENPYLQMGGILQLDRDVKVPVFAQDES